MKVACYCRVSTRKDQQLESFENQKEFFETYAERNGLEIYKIYADEGISRKQIKNRPQFLKMMADARLKLFGTLLVKDISRYARNTVDFLTSIRELKALGVNVKFITWNFETLGEDSEFVLTIAGAQAQEESKRLSTRVKFGKKINAEKGRVPNFVFGYNKVDTFNLEENPKEAEVVRKMFSLLVDEGYGTARIANYLNTNRILTKKNKVALWTQKTVIDILRNQIYIGKVINRKSEIKDYLTGTRTTFNKEDWIVVERPEFQLIDNVTFRKAQEILETRKDSFNLMNKRESVKYVFSNLLKCSECGYSFRRCQRKYSEDGKLYIWWACSSRNAKGKDFCKNNIIVKEEELLDILKENLIIIEKNKSKFVRNVAREIKNILKEMNKQESRSKTEVLKDIEAVKEEILYNIGLEKSKAINRDMLIEINQPLNKRLEDLNVELYQVNNQITNELDVERAVVEYFSKIKKISDIEFSNEDLKQIIDKIIVYPNGEIDVLLKVNSRFGDSFSIPLSAFNSVVSDAK